MLWICKSIEWEQDETTNLDSGGGFSTRKVCGCVKVRSRMLIANYEMMKRSKKLKVKKKKIDWMC